MRVTIREVAREAGVSIATVSRVFNNSGPVDTRTRQRIEDVARKMRYVPSGTARSLIMSRTSTLGILLPDLYGEFFSEIIRGIDRAARRGGFHLLVAGAHGNRAEIDAALKAMRGRVDGLLVMSPDVDADSLQNNFPPSLPVVLLNCLVEGDGYTSLNVDNFGGAVAIVKHLLELGHRQIAAISGSDRNHDARERLRGYRAAMREVGIRDPSELEYQGDFSEASGYEAALQILNRSTRPTAVFASNDTMAIGAMSALRQAGLEIGRDIAVAGFDDIPMARYMNPPLSTVHVGIHELGERGADRLLQAIREKNRGSRRREVIPTRLVIRSSCGMR